MEFRYFRWNEIANLLYCMTEISNVLPNLFCPVVYLHMPLQM